MIGSHFGYGGNGWWQQLAIASSFPALWNRLCSCYSTALRWSSLWLERFNFNLSPYQSLLTHQTVIKVTQSQPNCCFLLEFIEWTASENNVPVIHSRMEQHIRFQAQVITVTSAPMCLSVSHVFRVTPSVSDRLDHFLLTTRAKAEMLIGELPSHRAEAWHLDELSCFALSL